MEIHITGCRNGGIDCRVRGLTLVGRIAMTEEEQAAKFPFLTTVAEGEEEEFAKRQQQRNSFGGEDYSHHFRVFIWGLNDKGQLGRDPQTDPMVRLGTPKRCVHYI